jgi:uncharacterized protein (TIGR02265 family)
MEREPTIKGMFVMSHVDALEAKKGRAGIVKLLARYGKPIRFESLADVPLREEVAIIEHSLDILRDDKVPPEKRAFEAGKLHFENFSHTAVGGMLLPLFRHNVKSFFMGANHIAGYVFRGVRFGSEDTGRFSVRIVMENNDYPLDHFAGFFYGVLEYGGLKGAVTAEDMGGKCYAYEIRWDM